MADKTRLVMRQRVMTHSLAISSATACTDLDIAQSGLLADICICNYIVKPGAPDSLRLGVMSTLGQRHGVSHGRGLPETASVSTIRSAIVVRQRFFGIFWPLFLAGSERLRDNRRMTDAAHNPHSENPPERSRPHRNNRLPPASTAAGPALIRVYQLP